MKRFCLILLLLTVAGPAFADEVPDWVTKTKLSGYFFGDAYWMTQNHDPEVDGANGFWFRRLYLTFDYKISDKLSARVRLEGASPGDFKSTSTVDPFAKDLYLRWKSGDRSVYLGISGTPTWGVVEKVWGYRSVEKTLLDLQKLGSSRDLGVALKGKFGSGSKWGYHAMYGNGTTKGETNEDKKAMLSVGYYPSAGWLFELYGDLDPRPGGDRATWQAFAAYQADWGRIGLQVVEQTRERAGADDLDLSGASLFGVYEVSDKISVLGRIDRMFDPNPDGAKISYLPFDPTAESTLALVGVDYKLHKQVSFTPNLEYVIYDGVDGNPDPDDDLMLRLTFFVKF